MTSTGKLDVYNITIEVYIILLVKLAWLRRERRVPGAGEHGQPGILREARIGRGELAEGEDGATCGRNSAGVKAIRAQSRVEARSFRFIPH
jgi:hypothetical protein